MRDPEPQLQQDTQEDIKYMEKQFENHDCHASPEDGCDCQKIAHPNALKCP